MDIEYGITALEQIKIEQLEYTGQFKETILPVLYNKNTSIIKNGRIYVFSTTDKNYSDTFLINQALENTGMCVNFEAQQSFLLNSDKKKILVSGELNNKGYIKILIYELYTYMMSRLRSSSKAKIIYRSIIIEENTGFVEEDSLITNITNRYELYIFIGEKDDEVHEYIDGKNFPEIKELYVKVDNLIFNYFKKKKGIILKTGEYTCLLDKSFNGLLVHEVVGHALELDTIENRQKKHNYDGIIHEKGNSELNVIDFAGSSEMDVPIYQYVDKEGTLCRDTKLIENGVVSNNLLNLEQANRYNGIATGNVRTIINATSIVRMRNTIMLSGKKRFDEMVSTIDDGVYLMTPREGKAYSDGKVEIGIALGFEIKNGKIGDAIKNKKITTTLNEYINSITELSEDIRITGGFCNKGNMVYVGMGGPSVTTKMTIE